MNPVVSGFVNLNTAGPLKGYRTYLLAGAKIALAGLYYHFPLFAFIAGGKAKRHIVQGNFGTGHYTLRD